MLHLKRVTSVQDGTLTYIVSKYVTAGAIRYDWLSSTASSSGSACEDALILILYGASGLVAGYLVPYLVYLNAS